MAGYYITSLTTRGNYEKQNMKFRFSSFRAYEVLIS